MEHQTIIHIHLSLVLVLLKPGPGLQIAPIKTARGKFLLENKLVAPFALITVRTLMFLKVFLKQMNDKTNPRTIGHLVLLSSHIDVLRTTSTLRFPHLVDLGDHPFLYWHYRLCRTSPNNSMHGTARTQQYGTHQSIT